MQIFQENINSIVVIRIEGDIDLYSAPELRQKFEDAVLSGNKKIIVNMEKVSYLDSSGIGVIIFGLTFIQKSHGELVLVKINNSVLKLFDLSKITTFFNIYSTEEEALDSLKN